MGKVVLIIMTIWTLFFQYAFWISGYPPELPLIQIIITCIIGWIISIVTVALYLDEFGLVDDTPAPPANVSRRQQHNCDRNGGIPTSVKYVGGFALGWWLGGKGHKPSKRHFGPPPK